ncbi:MAG: ABC transporter permease, partial [Paracoccaceae bacterium]
MTDVAATPAAKIVPPPERQWKAIWQQFRTHKGAAFGLVVLSILILAVLIGPFVWHPDKLTVSQAIKVKNLNPSLRFPLGTDQIGRDMLYRMIQAGKVSLSVGFVAMLIAITFGTTIGILAGYFKRLDSPLMRMTDIFLSLPLIPLLLVMVMLFRDNV